LSSAVSSKYSPSFDNENPFSSSAILYRFGRAKCLCDAGANPSTRTINASDKKHDINQFI
jgi:hypothetical protein